MTLELQEVLKKGTCLRDLETTDTFVVKEVEENGESATLYRTIGFDQKSLGKWVLTIGHSEIKSLRDLVEGQFVTNIQTNRFYEIVKAYEEYVVISLTLDIYDLDGWEIVPE